MICSKDGLALFQRNSQDSDVVSSLWNKYGNATTSLSKERVVSRKSAEKRRRSFPQLDKLWRIFFWVFLELTLSALVVSVPTASLSSNYIAFFYKLQGSMNALVNYRGEEASYRLNKYVAVFS